jgi:dienelactone hydrolase
MRARVYVAAADADPLFPDAMKARLKEALDAAKVEYVLETYEGERHGFAPHDTPVHTKSAGERHWRSLLKLLAAKLQRS